MKHLKNVGIAVLLILIIVTLPFLSPGSFLIFASHHGDVDGRLGRSLLIGQPGDISDMSKQKPSTRLSDKRFTVTWECDGTTHIAYRSIEKAAYEFKARLREAGVGIVTIEEHCSTAVTSPSTDPVSNADETHKT